MADIALQDIMTGYLGIPRIKEAIYDKMKKQILGPAEARTKEAGIKEVESIIAKGHPADKIINTAKNKKVDLIVMGNRGRGMFSKTMMGSVSSKVCNQAETTCIAVK